MAHKKILLLYISKNSGHYMAALAVEKALKSLDSDVEVLGINAVNYTNPIAEKVVNKTYMGIIKSTPEVWDYLYDNPKILKSVLRLRKFIHNINLNKLKALIDNFSPSAVVCTQAFPCGMIADLKKTCNLNLPLFGVLTDHVAHAYWLFDNIDYYIVPSAITGQRLIKEGILEDRIKPFGIPIDPVFAKPLDKEHVLKKYGLSAESPVILIMGGGQGMGPIKNVTALLERSRTDFQMVVVTGTNKRLFANLDKRSRRCRNRMVVLQYAADIHELMDVASLIVTKPGGMTTSEAMAKNLPMIILKPIPGQEQKNTEYLTKIGVAVKAPDEEGAVLLAEELINNPGKLAQMKKDAAVFSKPNAAFDIAKLVLESCAKNEVLFSLQNRPVHGPFLSG